MAIEEYRMTTRPTYLLRDEDCPACGWPETYAEVDLSAETPGADAFGCRKCGWRTDEAADENAAGAPQGPGVGGGTPEPLSRSTPYL